MQIFQISKSSYRLFKQQRISNYLKKYNFRNTGWSKSENKIFTLLKKLNDINISVFKFDNLLYDNITNFYKSHSYIPSLDLSHEKDLKLVDSCGFYIFRITPLKDFWDIN